MLQSNHTSNLLILRSEPNPRSIQIFLHLVVYEMIPALLPECVQWNIESC